MSAISTLVEEATFEATAEGISFRGMDPSHVAFIDISWPNSAFEKYECDGAIKFGVRIDEFSKLIKRADKTESIQISIAESMLLFIIGKNKQYKMRLIESSATDTPLPKIPYDTKIGLANTLFDKILGDVQVVSDYLTIKTDDGKAEFSGKGDSGEVLISLQKQQDELTEIAAKEQSVGTYSLEYLNPIVKVLFLHGSDVWGNHPETLVASGLPRLLTSTLDFPAVVLSPQIPEDEVWWGAQLDEAIGLLDHVQANYAVDAKRLYLTGLSAGGFGAWAMAVRQPQRFTALAPIAGFWDSERDTVPRNICDIKTVPIWVFHGKHDDIVPPRKAHLMVDALKRCGVDGVSHCIPMRSTVNHSSALWACPRAVLRLGLQQKKTEITDMILALVNLDIILQPQLPQCHLGLLYFLLRDAGFLGDIHLDSPAQPWTARKLG